MTVQRKIMWVFAGLAVLIVLAVSVISGIPVHKRDNRFDPLNIGIYREAISLAEMGQPEQALGLVHRIPLDSHNNDRGTAFKDVVLILVRNKQDIAVLEFASSLEERYIMLSPMQSPFVHLAVAQAEIGESNRALETLKNIEGAYFKDLTKQQIAVVTARQGETDRAREILGMIGYKSVLASALNQVAIALLKTEGKLAARRFVDEALVVAQAIEKPDYRLRELGETAKTLAKLGYYKDAFNMAVALPAGDQRTSSLSEIARGHARAGRMEAAKETALQIDHSIEFGFVLSDIMATEMIANDITGALETAALARTSDDRKTLLINALVKFVRHHGDRGAPDPKAIGTAIAVVKTFESPSLRDYALYCIAVSSPFDNDILTAYQAVNEIENSDVRFDAQVELITGLSFTLDGCWNLP